MLPFALTSSLSIAIHTPSHPKTCGTAGRSDASAGLAAINLTQSQGGIGPSSRDVIKGTHVSIKTSRTDRMFRLLVLAKSPPAKATTAYASTAEFQIGYFQLYVALLLAHPGQRLAVFTMAYIPCCPSVGQYCVHAARSRTFPAPFFSSSR